MTTSLSKTPRGRSWGLLRLGLIAQRNNRGWSPTGRGLLARDRRSLMPNLTTKLTIEAESIFPMEEKGWESCNSFPPLRNIGLKEKISYWRDQIVTPQETEKTVDSERDPLMLSLLCAKLTQQRSLVWFSTEHMLGSPVTVYFLEQRTTFCPFLLPSFPSLSQSCWSPLTPKVLLVEWSESAPQPYSTPQPRPAQVVGPPGNLVCILFQFRDSFCVWKVVSLAVLW